MQKYIVFFIILLVFTSISFSQTTRQQQQNYLRYIEERKSPSTAMVLSILLPGGGHFYNGDIGSGILFSATRIGLISVTFLLDRTDGQLLFGALTAVIIFFDASEAVKNAKVFNSRLREKYNLSVELSGNRIGLSYHF